MRFVLSLLILATAAPAAAQSGEWRPVEVGGRVVEVQGDFDGDAQMDKARLVRNDTAGLLAVQLDLPGTGYFGRVAEGQLRYLPGVDLQLVAPGRYRTACGKGIGPRNAPCRPEIEISDDAFAVGYSEASLTYYVWNGGGFDEVMISD